MSERDRIRAAAVQMTSLRDVDANLTEAARLIGLAAGDGAELVVLPENFSFLGAEDAERVAAAEEPGTGAAQGFLIEQAAAHGIWIVGGTIPVRQPGGRAASRSLLVDPAGRIAGTYDKIHLFDVSVPGNDAESYRESATTQAGTQPVTVATPLGRIGMAVCYDVRFPALFHRLSVLGMDILVLPAAFTVPTGRVHWPTLLKARAVESLAHVIASAQVGEHAGGRLTYGHSMIVDAWGATLAELESGPGIAVADLDMIGQRNIRQKFPVLEHRREF